jgi:hypothetical protein
VSLIGRACPCEIVLWNFNINDQPDGGKERDTVP